MIDDIKVNTSGGKGMPRVLLDLITCPAAANGPKSTKKSTIMQVSLTHDLLLCQAY
jgi:hypothetical protein